MADPSPIDPGAGPNDRADAGAVAAVLAANHAFYDAFEARDLDAMSDIWERSGRVTCTHPGWATLRGWSAVVSSWYALFTNDQHLQFIVTDAVAAVVGDAAWVTCSENILDGSSGGTVAAMNIFVAADGRWRLVAHHGAPVVGR